MLTTRSVPIALALASMAAAPAHADDFYKGKTFNVVAGFSPGGGFDLHARGLGRHPGKHIPGNPNIIVQNQPGAGSLTSVRSLDVLAPKDGTVMTIFNPGLVTQSIVIPDKVKLDFRKYAWIGIVSADYRVCYGFGPDGGVKSWDGMMHRKEWVLGSTGKGAGNYINGATLRDVFDAPVKQVLGFPGSSLEQRLGNRARRARRRLRLVQQHPGRLGQNRQGASVRSLRRKEAGGHPRIRRLCGHLSRRAMNRSSCSTCSTPPTRSAGLSSCRNKCRRASCCDRPQGLQRHHQGCRLYRRHGQDAAPDCAPHGRRSRRCRRENADRTAEYLAAAKAIYE